MALSVALVVASAPEAALAEAIDEAEATDDVTMELEDEGAEAIVEDAAGDGEELAASEEAVPEEVAVPEEGTASEEEAVPQDEEAAPVEAEAEEPVALEPAAEDMAEEPALGEEPVEMTAQRVALIGTLTDDGEWHTSYIKGTDVAAYNAATDSAGRIEALSTQVWEITFTKATTFSVDAWSQATSFKFWLAKYNGDGFDPISDELLVNKKGNATLSASVSAGTYYALVASDTTVGGTYALRAYTAKRSFAAATVGSVPNTTYTGAAQIPAVKVKWNGTTLVKGVDYTVTGTNNKKPGTATLTITGKGLYAGSKAISFKIAKLSIKKVKARIGMRAWTGKAIKAKPIVKIGNVVLKKGVDYKIVKYVNNTKVGTAKVVIKGKGGLTGKRTLKFKIRYNVSKSGSVIGYYSRGTTTFNRFVFKKTNATMKSGKDYKLTVDENTSKKKVYKMVGKGNYMGTTYFTFDK